MPLNRFYLTDAGWVPESPIPTDQVAWDDILAADVATMSPNLDDSAVNPPVAGLARSAAFARQAPAPQDKRA